MGLGLGRGLAEHAQATIPGAWVGAWPKGREFEAGRGRASDPMWWAPIRFFLINCQATPQPKPRPNPSPAIPHRHVTHHCGGGGARTPRVNSCPQPKPHHTPRSKETQVKCREVKSSKSTIEGKAIRFAAITL
ncbi:hypothetical protein Hanom_Chr10g00904821 [Helianthus anomalus]